MYVVIVGELLVYSVNTETGELIEKTQTFNHENIIDIDGVSFFPNKLVKSSDGNQLYLSANFGVNENGSSFPWDESVLQFDIAADGSLTYVDRTIVEEGLINGDMAITSDGKFIYTSSNSDDIAMLTRAPNGQTTYIGSISEDLFGITFINVGELLISPDNNNLYASSTFNDGHLHVFSINQSTGALTSIQALQHEDLEIVEFSNDSHTRSKAVSGEGIAISADGLNLYTIPDRVGPEGVVGVFTRNSDGTIIFQSQIIAPLDTTGTTLNSLFSPDDIVVSPNQKYVYALDAVIGNILVFERKANGDLEFLDVISDVNSDADFSTGETHQMTISENGYYLYTNNQLGIIAFDLRTDLSIVKTDAVDPVLESADIEIIR